MSHVGVAISTTGDVHRMGLLVESVRHWDEYLPYGASLFVTVDGTEDDARRVTHAVKDWTGSVLHVGQREWGISPFAGRLGVATNKNTGLQALMDDARCDHLFLSDDDSWPLNTDALRLHTGGLRHSMVCWGHHRRSERRDTYADWSWPRGAVLYTAREVVETVGGMVEEFGLGGHEHVEWSRRIHNAGFTPVNYPSPLVYTEDRYLGAARYWYCEDMPKALESITTLMARRRRLTSVHRPPGYQQHIDKIMAAMEGSRAYVPYRAADNGRLSATMSPLV